MVSSFLVPFDILDEDIENLHRSCTSSSSCCACYGWLARWLLRLGVGGICVKGEDVRSRRGAYHALLIVASSPHRVDAFGDPSMLNLPIKIFTLSWSFYKKANVCSLLIYPRFQTHQPTQQVAHHATRLGCSDSRVPETTVCGLKPGEIFTHRNIANIISPTDINALSVIEYAVKYLKVQHVVLCGHTSCGGVAGTLGNVKLGVIDIWLQPMRALREKYSEVLDQLSGDAKTTKMSELNVQEGVNNIRRIPAVVDAMRERQMELHGMLFSFS